MIRREFPPGRPADTFSATPTRAWRFVLDPAAAVSLVSEPEQNTLRMIHDLAYADPPVQIALAVPISLATDEETHVARGAPLFTAVAEEVDPNSFALSRSVPVQHRDRLSRRTRERLRARTLLALTEQIQGDLVISDDDALQRARDALLLHHRIRIVSTREIGDILEFLAHGHSYFWSLTDNMPRYQMTADTHYQWSNKKNRRLIEWLMRIQGRLSEDVYWEMHSAIYNRYPFILYSRDMVRFYEFQMDHFGRRGLNRRFSSLLGYYVTNFYLYVWGMLDQLAVIANLVLGLGLPDNRCGIENRDFIRALGTRAPELRRFLRDHKMSAWISVMSDVRHPAAHRRIYLPTRVVEETDDSKKSDAEIREILRREEPDFYEVLPAEMQAILEPQHIQHWRLDHMKVVMENAIRVQTKVGGYFRRSVDAIDIDLATMTAVLDAFLVRLFTPGQSGEALPRS